jgi:hypothetical protein
MLVGTLVFVGTSVGPGRVLGAIVHYSGCVDNGDHAACALLLAGTPLSRGYMRSLLCCVVHALLE